MSYLTKIMKKTGNEVTIGDSLVLTGLIFAICALPVGILYVKEEIDKRKNLNESVINDET